MIEAISPIDNARYKKEVAMIILIFNPIKMPINEKIVLVSCSKNKDVDASLTSLIPLRYPLKASLIPTRGIKNVPISSGINNSLSFKRCVLMKLIEHR
jgi:hypothetical protein